MMPATASLVAQLKQLIYYHLDCDSPENASFLAARLHSIDSRNPDTCHLLSLTFLRLRQYQAAYDYSYKYGATGKHLGCTYIFAQACLALKLYHEGITALDKAKAIWVGRDNWSTFTREIPGLY